MEHTREIPGIDSRYQASADGHIISYMGKKPRQLAEGLSSNKLYHLVSVLDKKGQRKSVNVHRLVCLAFHGKPHSEGMQTSHLDGDSHNNRPENLLWETATENLRRKQEHGTHDTGTFNTRAHLTQENLREVRLLREQGWTQKAIADKLGVSRTTITRALSGARYGGQIEEA